jgi:hypothetical protein
MAGSMHVLSAVAAELHLSQAAQRAAISDLHNLQQVVKGSAHDDLLKISANCAEMTEL